MGPCYMYNRKYIFKTYISVEFNSIYLNNLLNFFNIIFVLSNALI